MKQAIVVQKYGGSSLRDAQALQNVAKQIVTLARSNRGVVVVVSAMGRSTEELMRLAASVSAHPPPRELDMLLTAGERVSMALLAMAVCALGHDVISLTGSQSGIITDERHSDARIVEVRPARVLEALGRGQIVIVAGYQGVSRSREVTTLGRGGSDTSAVALGAALGAEAIEILSDVEGVLTADPRLCPQAQTLSRIDFAPMRRAGALGARVLKAEAVAFATRANIAIVAAHSSRAGSRTTIGPHPGEPNPHASSQATFASCAGPTLLAVVERASWVSLERSREPRDAHAVIERAVALTGRALVVLYRGVLIDWTYALEDAHERLVSELRACDVDVCSVSCATLVGDMLLDETLFGAQRLLKELDVAILAEAHLPTSLSFVVAQKDCRRAADALHSLIVANS